MSVESLFDSRVRVYRLTETADSYGDMINTYTPLSAPARPNAYISPPRGTLQRTEAGNSVIASPTVFMGRSSGVQRFDVLVVTHGPETGRRFRVLDVATPRNNHKELSVETYEGELPE